MAAGLARTMSGALVLGQQLWQLPPDHVLVSSALLRDTAQYRQRLIPVVEALF